MLSFLKNVLEKFASYSSSSLTLLNNEGTCVGTEGVVQRYQHHAVAVRGLLCEDPFRTVLGVDADDGGGAGGQALGHETRAEVLGPQQGLVVAEPLVRLGIGLAPAEARPVI